MSRGHIRQRGPNSYEIKLYVGREDYEDGEGGYTYHSVKGTYDDAERRRTELLAALDNGSFVRPHTTTVTQLVADRIMHWETFGEITTRTAERYRQIYRYQIVPPIGTLRIQKLTTRHVERWHAKLLIEGRADGRGGINKATLVKAHLILQKALADAARHNWVSRNVAALQPPPDIDSEEVVILTADEIAAFLHKLTDTSMYVRGMVMMFTGLRRGEALALTWKHIDFDNKLVMVRQALDETKAHGVRLKTTKTKNGKRDVPLPDAVVDVLKAHRRAQLEQRMACGGGRLKDDDPVFPNEEGGFQAPRRISAQWKVTVRRLGFGHIRLGALRHVYASMLIARGVDAVEVSKLMGHSSPAITHATYAHLFDRQKKRSTTAINAAVDAALGRPAVS